MTSQRRGEETRAHILQAAPECSAEYGCDTTGVGGLPLR